MLLAKAGATKGEIMVSSSWLASHMGGSKQTAIRRLEELEDQGTITRRIGPRGQTIKITQAGVSSLRALNKELEKILKSSPASLILSGRVVTGMGEGSYYVGQPKYSEQFKKELGFEPYPGTLDVKLEKGYLDLKETLMRMPSKQAAGFKTGERTFGPVKLFQAKLKGIKVAIVMPNRTHHTDIIEIVASHNLRRKIGLKDGDLINVEVLP